MFPLDPSPCSVLQSLHLRCIYINTLSIIFFTRISMFPLDPSLCSVLQSLHLRCIYINTLSIIFFTHISIFPLDHLSPNPCSVLI